MDLFGIPSAVFKVLMSALLDFIETQKDEMEIK